MTIPQPPEFEPTNHLDFVVSGPNHNTDGLCVCGHAKTDHAPVPPPDDNSEPTWQCRQCSCTRAYPAPVPSTN
jgi:hypothetical protein